MKNKFIKECVWIIVILIVSILTGTVLMIASYALPTEPMKMHARETISMMADEGDDYKWILKDFTSMAANFTDSLMINTAVYDGKESLLEKALLNPRTNYAEGTQTRKLINALQDVPGGDAFTYGRYWHGYLVILKPLLFIFNYYQIRWLNTIIGCSLISIIMIGFYKKFGSCKYALAFAASVLFLNPVVMRGSLQYNTVFYVIMIEYIFALYKGDSLEKKGRYDLIFLMSGILVAFFDLLTYPIAALGMLLVLQLLMFESNFIKDVIRAARSSIVWIIGYLGMWCGKWVVASLLTDENIIADAIGEVLFRTGTDTGTEEWIFSWRELFRGNFIWIYGENAVLFKMFVIMLVAGVIALLIGKNLQIHFKMSTVVILLLFCMIPVARFIVFSNHSFMHSVFTYREGMIYVMAALCAGFSGLKLKEKRE